MKAMFNPDGTLTLKAESDRDADMFQVILKLLVDDHSQPFSDEPKVMRNAGPRPPELPFDVVAFGDQVFLVFADRMVRADFVAHIERQYDLLAYVQNDELNRGFGVTLLRPWLEPTAPGGADDLSSSESPPVIASEGEAS